MLLASRFFLALMCAAAVALGGSVSALATRAAGYANAELDVSSTSGDSVVALSVRGGSNRPDPIAGVTIVVPRGYPIDLQQTPGTEVGLVAALLEDAAGSGPIDALDGVLVAADPATYAQDAAAQTCAPGPHAAVWRAAGSVLDQPLDLLVFVDPVSGSSGAGYSLRLCPLWPRSSAFPGGLTASVLALSLRGAKAPTAPGLYTWSALVTPADRGTLTVQPERSFEVRTLIPQPNTLTLRAKYDAKASSVGLSGRLTAAGRPVAGASVVVTAYTGTYDYSRYGEVKTNAEGAFFLRRSIDRTSLFMASAYVPPRACTAPSSAPGGCLGETIASPDDTTTSLRVPRPTDAKREIRSRDAAFARRANLRKGDFPSDWEAEEPSPFAICEGFQPNLSDLTLTGEGSSPQFGSDEAGASSRASVYRSEAEARTAFRRTARVEVARCLARDLGDADFDVLRVGTLELPRLGDESRAFRVIVDYEQTIVYFDVLYLRRGRVVVEMMIGSLKQPLLDEQELAAKVAVRAGG